MQVNPVSYIETSSERKNYFARKYDYYDNCPPFYGYQQSSIGYEIPKTKIIIEKNVIPDITFGIMGKEFNVHPELKDIVDEITDSQDILLLQDDWDGCGAIPINPPLYTEAITFLLLYSTYILKEWNILITTPEINPCRNGSIDFSWRTDGARMLINVRNKDDVTRATFYGYECKSKLPKEGYLDMKNIEKDIASWMRNLK